MESYGKARKKAYVKSVLTIVEAKGFSRKSGKENITPDLQRKKTTGHHDAQSTEVT